MRKFFYENESWKNYLIDYLQIAAMVVVVGIFLWNLNAFLNWMK